MFALTDDVLKQIFLCTEAIIIIKEDTKEIVYANEYAKKWADSKLVGEKCHQAIMGFPDVCVFCPPDVPDDDAADNNADKDFSESFYPWDCYCCNHNKWLKIKSRRFIIDGVRYRVSNLNEIDDSMNLNTDTVREMAFQKRLLEENARMRAVLEYDATHDKLTGLFNKTKYLSDMNTLYKDIDCVGAVFFDVNNLKTVNDTLGHEMGDKMIAKMGTALLRHQSEQVRCYRFGGDEFVAVCLNSNPDKIVGFMDAVQRSLDKLNKDEPNPICVSAVGFAYSAHVSDDIDFLIKQADDAMYEDKKKKKAQRK